MFEQEDVLFERSAGWVLVLSSRVLLPVLISYSFMVFGEVFVCGTMSGFSFPGSAQKCFPRGLQLCSGCGLGLSRGSKSGFRRIGACFYLSSPDLEAPAEVWGDSHAAGRYMYV